MSNFFVMGLDPGKKSIGVAVTSFDSDLATPLGNVSAHKWEPLWPELDRLVHKWEPNHILVGLPLHMNGQESSSSRHAKRLAKKIKKRYQINTFTYDERLSSDAAKEHVEMIGLGGDATLLHQFSACSILMSWISAVKSEKALIPEQIVQTTK